MRDQIIIPDKKTYKTTVTSRLRDDMIELITEFDLKTYLEIGCDVGYTMMTMAPYVESMIGVDIDPQRINGCRRNVKSDNLTLITGTSSNIPFDKYDLVLIDADHSYDGVHRDTFNVMMNNKSDDFFIIFHDLGLVQGGVRKFVEETYRDYHPFGLEKNWNPLGGAIDGYEAAMVHIVRKHSNV